MKKILLYVGIGVGVIAAVAIGIIGQKYWAKHYAQGKVMSVVHLDDGAMVALEEITSGKDDENVDYRLRRYDAATGKDQARRLIDGDPECVAAKAGRIWCRWDGSTHLLDAKLESVSGLKLDGMQLEHLETDRDGGLLAMGLDGVPVRIDPATLEVSSLGDGVAAVKPALPHGMVLPIAKVGKALYELAQVKGQERAVIHVQNGKTLAPKTTYLADGFLADADQHALGVPGALFLVHRATIKPDAARTLTRVDLTGKQVWSTPIPEAVDTVDLDGDVIVLIGRTQTVGIAAADGAERYRTPH